MNERRTNTGRRASDKSKWVLHVQENWYRDVWLLIITVALFAIAIKALNTASDARQLGISIQSSRRELLTRNCNDQNKRNRNTVAQLDKEIATLPPVLRKRAQANKNFTVLLIDTLAPHQNCKKLPSAVIIHPPR